MLHDDVLKGKTALLIGDINIDLLKYNRTQVIAFTNSMLPMSFSPVQWSTET